MPTRFEEAASSAPRRTILFRYYSRPNMVFLGHLREKGRGERLWETAKFALVRSAAAFTR